MSVSEAMVAEDEGFNSDSEQYLTFMLAGEEYGVEILRVQGIQGWTEVTKIPNTPSYILGVINLRGAIVPIINLRHRFDLETIPFGPTTVVVVVKIEGNDKDRVIGLVVDAVSDVYRIDNENIQKAPKFGGSVKTEFIKGLTTAEEKMIIMLEIDKLFSFDVISDVVANEEVNASNKNDA